MLASPTHKLWPPTLAAIAPQLSPTAGVGFDALRAAQASYIAPAAAAALPKVTGAAQGACFLGALCAAVLL